MKTCHIKDLLKKDLLILELPENVKIYHDEDDEGNHIGYSLTKFGQDSVEPFGLINGYTLLGKPEEIKESDAEELVESGDANPAGDRFVLGYRSYFEGYEDDIPQFTCKTATESLLSAIETVIFWDVNPIKLNPIQNEKLGDIWGDKHSKWHEAQSRTFDRNRSIILVKN
jgi:hypothetical protein